MASKPTGKQKTIPNRHKPVQAITQKKTFHIPPWVIYALLATTAIIYSRALFNGFASLDDDDYLFDNPYIKNFTFDAFKTIFTSFHLGNYHPLTTLTFWFEIHWYGANPLPFHFLNILLHLINTFLVYQLIRKLSSHELTALLTAALFALHPMHVESVAWISERKDLLYTLFYLSALLVYLQYINNGYKGKHYLICLVLFLLSLFSKSAAVTLPVLLLVVDWYKGRKPDAKMFLEKIPLLLLSLLFGVLALLSQEGAIKDVSLEYSFFNRLFLFSYGVIFYILKLLVPFHLSAMHVYPATHGGFLPWYFYASLPVLGLLVWLTVRKTSLRREILFSAGFFLIVISVMLQIISVGNAITAERYTYISYIGLFYFAGQWISTLKKESVKKTALFISGTFILAMAILTWNRIPVWKNGDTLFTDMIKKYPGSYLAYWMRGNYKNDIKDYQSALQDYNRTLQMHPNFAECLTNRGNIFNELKDYKAALQDLDRSIKLDSTVAEAFNNRGIAYNGLGDTASALKDYNKALQLDPELQNAYDNRGVLKAIMGNLSGALTDVNKAIILGPNDGETYSNRANIKAMMKDFKGSFDDYSIALQYNPKENIVLFNRGLTRLNLNDTAGACDDWHRAANLGNQAAGEVISTFCR